MMSTIYKNKNISFVKYIDLCFFYLLLIFMWMFFAGNRGNADYENYLVYYNFYSLHIFDGVWYSDLEKGFSLLMKLSNFFNLTYSQFLGIYSFIALFLISNSILKYSKLRFITLLLYFSYQFFLDSVQIRNFMLLAIFLFSLRFLVDWYSNDKKSSLVKYVLLVIISSQFHITGLFFILPVFFKRIKLKKMFYIVTTITIFMFSIKNYILSYFSSALTDTRYSSYLEEPTTFAGSLLIIVYVTVGLYIIKQLHERILEESISINNIVFSELTIKFNILLILTIFLFSIRPDFIRIDRNILVLNYIVLTLCLKPFVISLKPKHLISSALFMVFFMASTYAFLWFSNIEGVIKPLFENNIYFN